MDFMLKNNVAQLPEVVKSGQEAILTEWMRQQLAALNRPTEAINEKSLRITSSEFLTAFERALQSGELSNIESSAWADVKSVLGDLSRNRAVQGFSPAETATFIFSLKAPLFNELRRQVKDAKLLNDEIVLADQLLDMLGLYTVEVYQRSREDVIRRQQQELLELSTPVIRIWEGVLTIPIIGTLDSARTQIVMENLLEQIVQTGSKMAILDITGVPTVDTQTAQHLIKTVAAAKLMGAECVISGIRPQIAQTIVHLGIELTDVVTKATMSDAVKFALARGGWVVSKRDGSQPNQAR